MDAGHSDGSAGLPGGIMGVHGPMHCTELESILSPSDYFKVLI